MEEVSADQGLTMAPRNSGNNTEPNNPNPDCEQEQDAEEDIHEIAAVNDSLDKLNNFLDAMEQRNADIRAQLIELLHSNREIRESFKAENETK